MLPTLFLSHGGGPCFFMRGGVFAEIDSVSPAAELLRGLEAALRLPRRPSALVVISAHWEGSHDAIGVFTRVRDNQPLLFDYNGFAPHTYNLSWPAPTAPAVAARACALLEGAGFATTRDDARGFDHGVFVPMLLAFPAADVATVQISLHGSLSPARHLALGRALAPLRAEGALIVGSGFATHNLREVARDGGGSTPAPWAVEFDAWLSRSLLSRDELPPASRTARWSGGDGGALPPGLPTRYGDLSARLENAASTAPHFARAHPRTEHWLPLLVALGAADPLALQHGGAAETAVATDASDRVTVTQLFQQVVMSTASLASFRFDSVSLC